MGLGYKELARKLAPDLVASGIAPSQLPAQIGNESGPTTVGRAVAEVLLQEGTYYAGTPSEEHSICYVRFWLLTTGTVVYGLKSTNVFVTRYDMLPSGTTRPPETVWGSLTPLSQEGNSAARLEEYVAAIQSGLERLQRRIEETSAPRTGSKTTGCPQRLLSRPRGEIRTALVGWSGVDRRSA